MIIRKARKSDFDEVLDIFAYARDFMKKTGNPNQWGEGYPSSELIRSETDEGKLFVIADGERVCGVFAFIMGTDETYLDIKGGWLNDEPYGVIHRIASAPGKKGVLKAALDFAEGNVGNVRIDTHEDNAVMRHLLSKYGYTECGIIRIASGSPRIAYHKKVR